MFLCSRALKCRVTHGKHSVDVGAVVAEPVYLRDAGRDEKKSKKVKKKVRKKEKNKHTHFQSTIHNTSSNSKPQRANAVADRAKLFLEDWLQ